MPAEFIAPQPEQRKATMIMDNIFIRYLLISTKSHVLILQITS